MILRATLVFDVQYATAPTTRLARTTFRLGVVYLTVRGNTVCTLAMFGVVC